MAWISAIVLVLHVIYSWLVILKLGGGLVGAAITLNTSWWLIIVAQLLYIFITKSDGAWSGFSWLTFEDLWGFVKLSLASAVMLWYADSYICSSMDVRLCQKCGIDGFQYWIAAWRCGTSWCCW